MTMAMYHKSQFIENIPWSAMSLTPYNLILVFGSETLTETPLTTKFYKEH